MLSRNNTTGFSWSCSSLCGFTLLELLVVITIIVVLLALLTPAMDKAITFAERAQCAGTLHAWGAVIPQYAFDNRRRMMSSIRHGFALGSNSVWPNLAWAHEEKFATDWAGDSKGGEWCAQRIDSYIGGGDFVNNIFGKMWYCPSNGAGRKDPQNATAVENSDWFVSDYAYFVGADIWGAEHATRPRELTRTRVLGGNTLLMADALHYEGGGSQNWWFNHGPEGWSTHHADWGGPVQSQPNISGTNQLHNDGSVSWFEADADNIAELESPSLEGHWVASIAGPQVAGNTQFYLKD